MTVHYRRMMLLLSSMVLVMLIVLAITKPSRVNIIVALAFLCVPSALLVTVLLSRNERDSRR